MEELLKSLNPELTLISYKIEEKTISIYSQMKSLSSLCPHCGVKSNRVHSIYTKVFFDLPVQDKKLKMFLSRRMFFCKNPECNCKTFAEGFDFIERYSRRTTRLNDEIMDMSLNMSARSAERIISKGISKISDDTILRIIKKKKY